jgi:replicative DNA helicase
MQKINEIARKNNITVIILAHYKKIGRDKPTNDDFKDASAIPQVANKIIHIYRDKEMPPNEAGEYETTFIISKNRSPNGIGEITGYFNINTYEYDFKKSEKQITRSKVV